VSTHSESAARVRDNLKQWKTRRPVHRKHKTWKTDEISLSEHVLVESSTEILEDDLGSRATRRLAAFGSAAEEKQVTRELGNSETRRVNTLQIAVSW